MKFMAKKIDGYIKLQIPTGKATPAPRRNFQLNQKEIFIKILILKEYLKYLKIEFY